MIEYCLATYYRYFGLQYGTICFCSNSLSSTTQYGLAYNCVPGDAPYSQRGGSYSNAVYEIRKLHY